MSECVRANLSCHGCKDEKDCNMFNAYQQGRADVIEEYVLALKKDLEFTEKYGDLIVKLAEQIKSNK